MELLKLQEAAQLLSVSYPTLKQWIYRRRIKSVKTPGGHHRIPRNEIERITGIRRSRRPGSRHPTGLDAISGRNKLLGTVTEVVFDGLLAQVGIEVGGQQITSIITRNACRELGLKKGVRAIALIKSTEVMVIRA
ncbi:MAG: TOBE domain-containing protein [Terriglobia bacterium]